jgi:hypothetical protein
MTIEQEITLERINTRRVEAWNRWRLSTNVGLVRAEALWCLFVGWDRAYELHRSTVEAS